jgi:hypothetical protein
MKKKLFILLFLFSLKGFSQLYLQCPPSQASCIPNITLAGGVVGSGTNNTIPKFTNSKTLGNSNITNDANSINFFNDVKVSSAGVLTVGPTNQVTINPDGGASFADNATYFGNDGYAYFANGSVNIQADGVTQFNNLLKPTILGDIGYYWSLAGAIDGTDAYIYNLGQLIVNQLYATEIYTQYVNYDNVTTTYIGNPTGGTNIGYWFFDGSDGLTNSAGFLTSGSYIMNSGEVNKPLYLDGGRNIVTSSPISQVDLTTQSAAKTATTLYTIPSGGTGMFKVSYVATITRAATTSSILGGTNGFQIVYTDANDNVVKTSLPSNTITSAANTTATTISGTLIGYCKQGTNIQYKFDYTSVGATTMQYNLHIKTEPF